MSVVAKRLDDQDATWYGGRPWPLAHCIRWGPSSPSPPSERGTTVPFFWPMFILAKWLAILFTAEQLSLSLFSILEIAACVT